MKNKKAEQKILSFRNVSSPYDFAARIKEGAINSNLKVEQNDTDFILQLNSNHGGRIVYKATVTADESGGSYISGEIVTIPWGNRINKKESIIEKIEADLYSEKTITGKIPNETNLIEIAEKYGTVDKTNKKITITGANYEINFSEIEGWNE